jgi:hypothetical protein
MVATTAAHADTAATAVARASSALHPPSGLPLVFLGQLFAPLHLLMNPVGDVLVHCQLRGWRRLAIVGPRLDILQIVQHLLHSRSQLRAPVRAVKGWRGCPVQKDARFQRLGRGTRTRPTSDLVVRERLCGKVSGQCDGSRAQYTR